VWVRKTRFWHPTGYGSWFARRGLDVTASGAAPDTLGRIMTGATRVKIPTGSVTHWEGENAPHQGRIGLV